MKISWHQLTLDLNLPIWCKSNIWSMFSTQFQPLSLNLMAKITFFQNIFIFVENLIFVEILQVLLVFKKLLFLPSNSSSGPKTEWETCSICLIFVKLSNSGPMSADVSWFWLDFKNTFWHEKMPIYSHNQSSYLKFENFIGYLDFQKDSVFI